MKDKNLLLIIITFIILVIILLGYFIVSSIVKSASPCAPPLKGELKYLSNVSNSTDPKKGIWLEIILENPKKAPLKWGEIFIIGGNSYTSFYCNESKNSYPVEKNGYFFEFYDWDGDQYISSGDMIHIYGNSLVGKSLEFIIRGYSGNITIHV